MAACQGAPDPHLERVTQSAFDAIRKQDRARLDTLLAPNLKAPQTHAELAQVRTLIPAEEPDDGKTVAWRTVSLGNEPWNVVIQHEYDYGTRAALVTTNARQTGPTDWEVQGFHFQIATDKELAVNDLTLTGRKPIQYLFLILTVLSPLLMAAAVIKVLRTPGLERRWVWVLASLFGVCSFQMNWASAQIGIQWAAVRLIGAGVVTGVSRFDPWMLTMTLPVGAVLILAGVWARPQPDRLPVQPPAEPPAEPPTAA